MDSFRSYAGVWRLVPCQRDRHCPGEADLPVVGERTYLATLPFRFEVDVKDKAVVSWTPLFDAGRIEESTQ